ncbi:hypothetical protein Ae707Ps1_6084c [Pseudonocardia sp. Ae707_Ps1]|nr:hypothetical protein Ae707Ps1_6084c [Pseudonocardia sp. Ae707_Ps1]
MNESYVRGDQPRPDVYRVRVEGLLDTAAGSRMLRQLDAHLHLIRSGLVGTRHLLVDLSAAVSTPRGMRALPHIRHAAQSQQLTVHLIGAHRLAARLTPAERAVLRGLHNYPDMGAALRDLSPAPA